MLLLAAGSSLTGTGPFERHRLVKGVISSSILACWLWAITLAASPSLHEWAHGEEEGHGEHECVATLLAAGGCGAPDVAPLLAPVPEPVDLATLALPRGDVRALFLIGSPLEHGPPVARG